MSTSMVGLIIIVYIAGITSSSTERTAISATGSGPAPPTSSCTGLKLFLHNTLNSMAKVLQHLRHAIVRLWNRVVHNERNRDSYHGYVSHYSSQYDTQSNPTTSTSSTKIEDITGDAADHDGDRSQSHSGRIQPPSRVFLDPSHVDAVTGDAGQYVQLAEFELSGYSPDEIVQALLHMTFQKRVPLNSAETVQASDWTSEGPWSKRFFTGTTRKDFLVQPEFRQIQRYGYLSDTNAIYIIDHEVLVRAGLASANITVIVKIKIDQQPTESPPLTQLTISLKVTGSGSSFILKRGLPKATDMARIDYLKVQHILADVLDSDVLFRRPEKQIVMTDSETESPQSSPAPESVGIGEPLDESGASTSMAVPRLQRTNAIRDREYLSESRWMVSSFLTFLLQLILLIMKLGRH